MNKLKKILATAVFTFFLAMVNITFIGSNVGLQFSTNALADMPVSCSGCTDCLGANCGGDRSYCGLLENINTGEYVSCDFDNQ